MLLFSAAAVGEIDSAHRFFFGCLPIGFSVGLQPLLPGPLAFGCPLNIERWETLHLQKFYVICLRLVNLVFCKRKKEYRSSGRAMGLQSFLSSQI